MFVLHRFAVAAVLLAGALCFGQTAPGPRSADGKYVIIGYNDLGMHCINPRFSEICLLPPANNLNAIVIRRGGEEPHRVTTGLTVSYALVNNTTVAGKTDFWTYAPSIFGVSLPLGVGLTGNGLSGTMKAANGQFQATAIPALPRNDDGTWNPYQVATLKLKSNGTTIAQTNVVVPVSDEMNCQKCHASGGIAATTINMPTVEQNILTLHDRREKTSTMGSRPVLCSKCHADPALKMPGQAGVASLSLAMHKKHASLPLASQPACYDCHPGAKTQCSRSAIKGMGPVGGTGPGCEKCHGTLTQVAQKLIAGRQPWVQEPKCSTCHGAQYDTGTTLFRNANGHGGVPCIACHNSPHAWWPSTKAVDNQQPLKLQGTAAPLGKNACYICHTDGRKGAMPPHGGDD